MTHYLNVSKLTGSELEPVDIITFGSPCQGLSVAGEGLGLEDERSNLFYEAIRIIKEMRLKTDGLYPRYALWENVPGALSNRKGKDFEKVLEAFLQIIQPEAPLVPMPKKGWPRFGRLHDVDGRWSIAWRVVDARTHGVPQRRRRILLVADFRGDSAGEILFKCQGLPGYPEPSGETWKGTAGTAENCSPAPIGFHLTQGPISLENATPCLSSSNPKNGQASIGVCYGFLPRQGAKAGGIGFEKDVVPTLRASQEIGICYSLQNFGKYIPSSTASTLKSRDCKGATDLILFENHAQEARHNPCGDTAPTVVSRYGTGGNNQPLVVHPTHICYGISPYHSAGMKSENPYSGIYEADSSRTLDLNGGNPSCNQGGIAIVVEKLVRRLTPTECARLQGFPDLWGSLPRIDDMSDDDYLFWCDLHKEQAEIQGKEYHQKSKKQMISWYNKLHTDSAEYKMWGNGVALPAVRVPIHGMAVQGAKTLGSLFDGSGGFPLAGCLEGIIPLWSAEIEPYPVAVAKAKFM